MKKTLLVSALLFALLSVQAQDEKQTYTRKILLEQFTTSQCGWCPAGADRIHSAIGTATNILWIKHHAGFGTDFLTNDIHTRMLVFYDTSTFAPAMMVDRTRFNTERPGPVTSVGQVAEIQTLFAYAKQVATACKVLTPEIAYNPNTRKVTGRVRIRFGDEIWNANTRITVYLIEDSLIGIQSDYNHGTQQAYVHMGTVRDTLTNMWGDALEVNASDRTSRYTIDYTLPDSYVYSHCKLVALVSNYDSEDVNNCKVLNAAESAFLDEVPGELAGIGTVAAESRLRLYPNPACGQVVLEADEEIASVQVVNALGQVVYSAQPSTGSCQQMTVNTTMWPQGVYVVRVRTAAGTAERRLAVVR